MSKATPPVETLAPAGSNMRYQLLDQICVTSGSRLYRARCLDVQGASAVLKLPNAEGAIRLSRFRREYEALHALDIPGVIKPIALKEDAGRLMMVLKQVEGEPLEAVLARGRLDLPDCLRLAGQLAEILDGLHAAHLIHQDLRPANLMVGGKHISLLDLSLARTDVESVADISETAPSDWPYLSPEQTGRLNRPVDYRTDFYSLGMVLYRMLTGQLPFKAADALEWAHCHIARIPPEPVELCPDLPPIVSAIVMKLLAKLPEDRYQSARGLRFDLCHCLDSLQAGKPIELIALGARDIPDRFQIPHQLYGRDEEKEQLLGVFQQTAAHGRTALVSVAGPAGIGKSVLVHELQKPIAQEQGYFISGKFDQHQRDIPYATLTQAFAVLVQQLLSESEACIDGWRERIRGALGVNGQLIVDLLPQVELIIGKQPSVPALAPTEARNRFQLVLRRFIGVFARRDHPLVVFLDDLQWADVASIDLIGELLRGDMRHLLLIGAYRDNEVGPTHPLMRMLDEARKQGQAIDIALGPLPLGQLTSLAAATLRSTIDETAALAALIHEKTGGNPFFATQFLGNLHDQRLIRFDTRTASWHWNIERIRSQKFTDNVVDLMLEKLARLPERTQQVLKHLACLGNAAELPLLAIVHGQTEAQTTEDLREAVRAGLATDTEGMYRFLHDRVQEAAYSLIPETSRSEAHLRIGRLMKARWPEQMRAERIFDVVNQFDRGLDGISDAGERQAVCDLNRMAGSKAKATVAYGAARAYFAQAVKLLPDDAWQTNYQDTFALYLDLAECEYLDGRFEQADALFDCILDHVRSDLDRAKVCVPRMKLCHVAGRHREGLHYALDALRRFGVFVPDDDTEVQAATTAELREIQTLIAGRRIADIALAPTIADPEMGMILTLLTEALSPAHFARPATHAWLVCKAVKLSLCHGNHPASCRAYSTFGAKLVSEFGIVSAFDDIDSGFEFSRLAVALNEKFGDRRLRGLVLGNHATLVGPWRRPFASLLPDLEQAIRACMEVGDVMWAGHLWFMKCARLIEQGMTLDEVRSHCEKHLAHAREHRNQAIYLALLMERQFVASLQGRTRSPTSFDDADFDEAREYARMMETSDSLVIGQYHVMKQINAFIYGRHAEALAAARRAHAMGGAVKRWVLGSTHAFYHALSLTALFAEWSADEQEGAARTLAELLKSLKFRADHCAANWCDRYSLVAAEIARIEGRDLEAMRLYQQAARSAHDNGFVHNEALTSELAANFYHARGLEDVADACLRRAHAAYERWGADGKVAELVARYPRLRGSRGNRESGGFTQLDLLSVSKAAQAISGRIVLDELVDTLMRVVVESAGAQTGALVLARGGHLVLAAEVKSDQRPVRLYLDLQEPVSESGLPMAILTYVRRTREQVLLGDTAQAHPFANDPYFSIRQPKCLLCLPVMRQSNLVGLLYLENNLLTHAFTQERLTVLELLSSQAAISLENALLYADLQRENRERRHAEAALRRARDELEIRVRERTHELTQSNEKLAASNNELEQFAYVASHDLQEPLRMVGSYMQLLRRHYGDKPDDSAQEFIEYAVDGATRMQALIDDLLNYSRVGTKTRPFQAVDLQPVVRYAVTTLSAPIQDSNAQIEIVPLPTVTGDPGQLGQLFQNLIGNALKFRGASAPQVKIDVVPDGDHWRFSVRDNGIGIAPEYKDRIFVMFQRLHTRRQYEGTGIGLAICKKIVERHGGHIWVEPNPQGGSIFQFTLPRIKEGALQ